MGIKKSFFPFIVSILILGTLGMVPLSYAGNGDVPPPWDRMNNCAVTHQFDTFGTPGDPTDPGGQTAGGQCTAGNLNTDPSLNDAFCETTVVNGEIEGSTVQGKACHIHVPNFDDPFNTKLLRINVFWSGATQPIIFNVKPAPGATSNDCIFEQQVIVGPGHFYEDWRCHPNPDNERIWFTLDTRTNIIQVVVDSISFDRQAVGGEFIPIDATAVLIAGAQSNAISILTGLMVIGAVVFGALYVSVKRKNTKPVESI